VPSNEGGEGMVLFLSLDGLYMVPAGCQTSAPVPVSREKLPDELLFIDKTAYEVTMAYDQLDRGVHIYMSSRTSGNTTHWWFDWKTKGFFQVTLPVGQDPFTVLEYSSSCGEDSCVLMGGRDGVVRRFHKYNDKDDGSNAISSAVDYGPIMLGDMNGWTSGVLSELVGELGEDSAPVNWSARSGNTPEAAYNATALADGTWSETGLQYTNNPRCGGAAAFVRLSNGANRPWSIERMAVRIEPKGRNTR
jgi:hypothetical protein